MVAVVVVVLIMMMMLMVGGEGYDDDNDDDDVMISLCKYVADIRNLPFCILQDAADRVCNQGMPLCHRNKV